MRMDVLQGDPKTERHREQETHSGRRRPGNACAAGSP